MNKIDNSKWLSSIFVGIFGVLLMNVYAILVQPVDVYIHYVFTLSMCDFLLFSIGFYITTLITD